MVCKSCGHPNSSTAVKCASCGTELDNERIKMFQAQAQSSKGMEVSLGAGATPAQETQSSQGAADEFFADVPALKPTPAMAPSPRRAPPAETAAPSFFSHVEAVSGEPAFETEIADLKNDEKAKGPPEHALYSVPTNAVIEAYIARRAAARK